MSGMENLREVEQYLNGLAAELKAAKGRNRHWYAPILAKIYHKKLSLKSLTARLELDEIILALQKTRYRTNSTTFGALVSAVCDRANINPKTASRWTKHLNEAWDESIPSDEIEHYLQNSH